MEIQGQKQDRFYVVTVQGRMDAVSAPGFEQACAQWMEQGEKAFVVDLGGLEYISSAGLRSILLVAKKLKTSSGSICFCGLTPMVAKVFTLSGFATMFPLHDSLSKAMGEN